MSLHISERRGGSQGKRDGQSGDARTAEQRCGALPAAACDGKRERERADENQRERNNSQPEDADGP